MRTAKGLASLPKLQSIPALKRRSPSRAGGSYAELALSLYLLELQEERLQQEKKALEEKKAANEKKLKEVSKQVDDILTSNAALREQLTKRGDTHVLDGKEKQKVKAQLAKGKAWHTMSLGY